MGTVKANAFCVSITYLSSFKRYILLLVTPLKYPVYYRSDIRIRRFRPHVARSVTIRRHRTCYVYMVIHGSTWSYMVVYGRTWSYMVVHATCTWSYMPRVHCRTCHVYMVVHAACTWSYMVVHGRTCYVYMVVDLSLRRRIRPLCRHSMSIITVRATVCTSCRTRSSYIRLLCTAA